MTSLIPIFGVIVGLGALAGAFYLLQRLRVRQKPVTVETTLFWKDAIEDARARVLVQRFRHPWVYALLLLIGSLLWLGFAGIESDGGGQGRQVVLIDASGSMTQGSRFADTLESVDDYVNGLSPANRLVIVCGGRPQTVLRPGEDAQLLRKRLEGIEAEACPASVGQVIAEIAPSLGSEATICIAGDASLSKTMLGTIPDGVEIVRLSSPAASDMVNSSITAMGFAPADSGEWDKVDVLVEVVAAIGDASTPELTLAGRALSMTPKKAVSAESTQYFYKNLPARGEILQATIANGGAVSVDDTAVLLIPDRRRLAVVVAPGVPEVLVRALEADPGVVVVADGARVAVRPVGDQTGQGLPAMEIATEAGQADGILAIHAETEDPNQVLMTLHQKLGLSEIDASDLSRENATSVTMGAAPGPERALKVWNSLLTNEFNFTRSRSFPLFVGMGIRWLASFVPAPQSVPVGQGLVVDGSVLRDDAGRAFDTLGDVFRPVRAGRYSSSAGVEFAATYLGGGAVAPEDMSVELATASAATTSGSLVSVVLLIAMMLILGEWILFRLGRIP